MRLLGILAAVGGLMPAAVFAEGDPAAGRKVAGMCRTCHGLDGYAVLPIAPNIGGESASYLARQLEAFRSGEREHEVMSVIAASLSDQQIADVSAWYASHVATAVHPGDPAEAPVDCASCHGIDGIAVIDDAPNLAGESNIYLDSQLKAFRSGRRESPIMSEIAAELDDETIRALADWYAASVLTIAPPPED